MLALPLDVTDQGQIDAAVATARSHFGRIDVLVNNAGHGSVGAVEELDDGELRALMDTMFFGAVALTRAVLPVMRAQGAGAIVQMSSMGGQVTLPGFGAYCAAKFALEAMSESLAAEVAPFGIRVLIVEPGAFRTAFGGARMQRSRDIGVYAEHRRADARGRRRDGRLPARRPGEGRRRDPSGTRRRTRRRCTSRSATTPWTPSPPPSAAAAPTSRRGRRSAAARRSTPDAAVRTVRAALR